MLRKELASLQKIVAAQEQSRAATSAATHAAAAAGAAADEALSRNRDATAATSQPSASVAWGETATSQLNDMRTLQQDLDQRPIGGAGPAPGATSMPRRKMVRDTKRTVNSKEDAGRSGTGGKEDGVKQKKGAPGVGVGGEAAGGRGGGGSQMGGRRHRSALRLLEAMLNARKLSGNSERKDPQEGVDAGGEEEEEVEPAVKSRQTRRGANSESGSARAGKDEEETGVWSAGSNRAAMAMVEEAVADAGARATVAAKARGASSLVAAMKAATAEAEAEAAVMATAEAGSAWFLAAVSNGDPAVAAVKKAATDAGVLAFVAALADDAPKEEAKKASITAAVRVVMAALAKKAAREDPAIEKGAQILAAMAAKGTSARGKGGPMASGKGAAQRKAPAHAVSKDGAASGNGGASGKGAAREVEAAALDVGATHEDAVTWAAATAQIQRGMRATGATEELVVGLAQTAKHHIAASGGTFPVGLKPAAEDAGIEAHDLAFAAAVAKGALAEEAEQAWEEAGASVLDAGTMAIKDAYAQGALAWAAHKAWAEAIAMALAALPAKAGAERDKGGTATTGKNATQGTAITGKKAPQEEAQVFAAGKRRATRS